MKMGYQSKEEEEEFWPVEHPMEPPDEDRPVRCPMPDSSLANNGRKQERKRADIPVMTNKDGAVVAASENPVRAVRKRHHTLTHGDYYIMAPSTRIMSFPPQLPNQNTSIFQMLQQHDER